MIPEERIKFGARNGWMFQRTVIIFFLPPGGGGGWWWVGMGWAVSGECEELDAIAWCTSGTFIARREESEITESGIGFYGSCISGIKTLTSRSSKVDVHGIHVFERKSRERVRCCKIRAGCTSWSYQSSVVQRSVGGVEEIRLIRRERDERTYINTCT